MNTSDKVTTKPAIIYDGECSFCRQQMERVKNWDSESHFSYHPRQDPQTELDFPAIKTINLEEGLLLVGTDQKIFVGAEAIFQIASVLEATKWLSWLYLVPGIGIIARAIYRWIINNRYKLAGRCKDGNCQLR